MSKPHASVQIWRLVEVVIGYVIKQWPFGHEWKLRVDDKDSAISIFWNDIRKYEEVNKGLGCSRYTILYKEFRFTFLLIPIRLRFPVIGQLASCERNDYI